MGVVSVSLPDSVVGQVDGLIEEGGYAGRSDVIRAALRAFFHDRASSHVDKRESRTGTVTVVYAEGGRKVAEIRHTYGKFIRAALHAHSGDNCVEVFVVEGTAGALRTFEAELRAARETLSVHVVLTDPTAVLREP